MEHIIDTTKECPTCNGDGEITEYEYEGAVPEVSKCPKCNGAGWIELTPDEIAMEDECRREDARC